MERSDKAGMMDVASKAEMKPPAPKATHVFLRFPSNHMGAILRAEDGVNIAEYQNYVLNFGQNPNRRESRVLRDEDHAVRYMKERITQDDLKARAPRWRRILMRVGFPAPKVVIEEVIGEGLVTLAEGSVDIADMSAIRPVGKVHGGQQKFN